MLKLDQSPSRTAVVLAGSPCGTSCTPDVASTQRELSPHSVDAGHVPVGDELRRPVTRDEIAEHVDAAELDVDPRRGEHDIVGIARERVGDLVVHRAASLVQLVEGPFVGERAAGRRALHAPRRQPGRPPAAR